MLSKKVMKVSKTTTKEEKTFEIVPFEVITNKDQQKEERTPVVQYVHPAEKEQGATKMHLYLLRAYQEDTPRIRLLLMPGRKEDIIGTEVPNEILKKGVIITSHGDKVMAVVIGWAKFVPREYNWSPEDLGLEGDAEVYNIPVLLVTSTIKMSRMWTYIAQIYELLSSGEHIFKMKDYYLKTTIFLSHRFRSILVENQSLKEALLTAEYNIISAAERFGALLFRKKEEAIPGGIEEEKSLSDRLKEFSDLITYLVLTVVVGGFLLWFLYIKGIL